MGIMERKRILVVDRYRDAAESLGELLQLRGYETYVVFDGNAALTIAEDTRPDAVILDIYLPGTTGCDVCRQLRATSWGECTLIIALTGWARQQDRAAAREAGCDYYLLKPASFERVEAYLSEDRRRKADSGGVCNGKARS